MLRRRLSSRLERSTDQSASDHRHQDQTTSEIEQDEPIEMLSPTAQRRRLEYRRAKQNVIPPSSLVLLASPRTTIKSQQQARSSQSMLKSPGKHGRLIDGPIPPVESPDIDQVDVDMPLRRDRLMTTLSSSPPSFSSNSGHSSRSSQMISEYEEESHNTSSAGSSSEMECPSEEEQDSNAAESPSISGHLAPVASSPMDSSSPVLSSHLSLSTSEAEAEFRLADQPVMWQSFDFTSPEANFSSQAPVSSSPPIQHSNMQWSITREDIDTSSMNWIQTQQMTTTIDRGDSWMHEACAPPPYTIYSPYGSTSPPVSAGTCSLMHTAVQSMRPPLQSYSQPRLFTEPLDSGETTLDLLPSEQFDDDRRKRRRLLLDRPPRPAAAFPLAAAFRSDAIATSMRRSTMFAGVPTSISNSAPPPRASAFTELHHHQHMATLHPHPYSFSSHVFPQMNLAASYTDAGMFSSPPTSTVRHMDAYDTSMTVPAQPTLDPPLHASALADTPVGNAGVASSSSLASSPSPTYTVPSNYLRSTSDQHNSASMSSLVKYLYNLSEEEMGHRTFGHSCVSREEVAHAAAGHHDLLYGEILPIGATKLFDRAHLDLRSARTVCDLGSGLGKLAIQAFLQYPTLTKVFGCELSSSRFQKSCEAIVKLHRSREGFRRYCVEQQRERYTSVDSVTDESEPEEEQKMPTQQRMKQFGSLPQLNLESDLNSTRTAYTAIRFHESAVPAISGRQVSSSRPSDIDPLWSSLQMFESYVREREQPSESQFAATRMTQVESPGTASVSASPPPHSDRVARLLADEYAASRWRSSSSLNPSVVPPSRSRSFSSIPSHRTLELRCQNLFEMTDAFEADVVICETKFPEENYAQLCSFLSRLKVGCRLLTYENLDICFHRVYGKMVPDESDDAIAAASGAIQRIKNASNANSNGERNTTERDTQSSMSSLTQTPITRRTRSFVPPQSNPMSPDPAPISRVSPDRDSSLSLPSVRPPLTLSPMQAPRESKRKRESNTNATTIKTTEASTNRDTFDTTTLTGASSRYSSSPTIGSSFSPSPGPHPMNPFKQMAINIPKQDRFYTSWASNLGHHFFLWTNV